MPNLSIIILSYKSRAHLEVLLPSIWESEGVDFNALEVIVVDNDSKDDTLGWLQEYQKNYTDKNLKILPNVNNGFAKGNNLGIKQCSGRYILLLNPDTKLSADTLKIMLDFMDRRPDVGISGCKLVKADGKLDLACRRRFPNPRNSFARLFLRSNQNYNYSDVDENTEMEVDSVVGAFLLIRRSVMDKIGLLDEDYFMYGEDLDWCWKCKQAGYKVWYYPKTTTIHYKGESSKKARFKTLKAFHDAMWIFYKKHYSQQYPFFFSWLIWLAIYGRLTVLFLVRGLL